MKKGDLAELADVRAGTISAVANSPRPPEVPTLQRLADGFTKFDRRGNTNAPAVGLWQFFVTDEEAGLFVKAKQHHQESTKQEDLTALVIKLAPAIASAIQSAAAPPTPQPTTIATESSSASDERASRSEKELARGSLSRGKRAS